MYNGMSADTGSGALPHEAALAAVVRLQLFLIAVTEQLELAGTFIQIHRGLEDTASKESPRYNIH